MPAAVASTGVSTCVQPGSAPTTILRTDSDVTLPLGTLLALRYTSSAPGRIALEAETPDGPRDITGTGVAFVLMGRLVGRVGATRASIVGYLIPVVALVLGVLFRDDVVGPIAIVGVALVVAGAYLTSRRETVEV